MFQHKHDLLAFQPSMAESLEFKFAFENDHGQLKFQFQLSGPELNRILLPSVHERKERKDGLWQTTAFELFIGNKNYPQYIEMNLSPTGDWNIYEFASERQGMKAVLAQSASPLVRVMQSEHVYEIQGVLDLQILGLKGALQMSATSVLEFADGHKEYWALVHHAEKPDFHRRSSFVATIS